MSVVELEPDLAVDHDGVVDRGGGVHAVGLERLGQPRGVRDLLGDVTGTVELGRAHGGVRRQGQQDEPGTAGGRQQ